MKRIIPFSRYFIPAAILSLILVGSGAAGLIQMGFNLGIDFQPGLNQEVQFAPTAFSVTYDGPGTAAIAFSRSSIDIIISGSGIEEAAHSFPFAAYTTLNLLESGFTEIEGLRFTRVAAGNTQTAWLIQSAQSSPRLEPDLPFAIHYLNPNSAGIDIANVRSSLLNLGNASVQVLGIPEERRFMIRMEESDLGSGGRGEMVIPALEAVFGQGEVVLIRSDFVGSRFAGQLRDQAAGLLAATLLLILAYCSFRFKFQYALGAVLAIMHDGLIAVAFIVWAQVEFNTITIAALLTVMGYSINDTIVVFDRMKETRKLYPDDTFVNVLNRAITETLNRTIITTFTTMLAVASLFVFTTGSMKDFAAILLIGMTAGIYSTIFIASGFVYFWEKKIKKRAKKITLEGVVKDVVRGI